MKNITITLDEKTAVWVRTYAADHNKNVSRLISEILHKYMRESREYDKAMRRYFAHKPFKFVRPDGRNPTREDLYDRAALRRR